MAIFLALVCAMCATATVNAACPVVGKSNDCSCNGAWKKCQRFDCEYSNDNLAAMEAGGDLNCEGVDERCQATHCKEYSYKPGPFAFSGPAAFTATIFKKLSTQSVCLCDTELDEALRNCTSSDANACRVCQRAFPGNACGSCSADDAFCAARQLDDGCCVQGEFKGVSWQEISEASVTGAAAGVLLSALLV